MFISDFSFDRMKGNLSLVNSEWTGRRFRDLYGVEPVTLYPPVPGAFPHVPWEEREDGFVCIGRIHPGKRLDWIIETIARTRRIAPRLRLHIVGTRGQKPEEVMRLRRLRPFLEANSSWVHLHEDLPRDELANLAARQRYGIHAQVDEHFGIAPAEMVRAGCITFVHDSGGQVEIMGNDPATDLDSTSRPSSGSPRSSPTPVDKRTWSSFSRPARISSRPSGLSPSCGGWSGNGVSVELSSSTPAPQRPVCRRHRRRSWGADSHADRMAEAFL